MALNVLSICQSFARRQGLPSPTYAIGNPDAQVAQMIGLLEEFVDDLITRGMWQIATREAVFTSIAAESQGNILDIASGGYRGIVPDTFFDRTQMLEVPVAISPQEWQVRKALNLTGPLYQARIRGGQLLFTPAPPAGHTMAFEYYSENFVNSLDSGGNPITVRYPDRDDNTFIVNDSLAIAYLRWAWKEQKGLDYAEDFRKYERLVSQEKARSRVPMPVKLDVLTQDPRPGIVVPPGSWNL